MSISDIIPLLLFFSSYIYDGGSRTHWKAAFFYYWGEKEGERKVEKRNTSSKFFKENY